MKSNESTALRTLFWEATLRCNAYCAFCGSRCGDHPTENFKEELDAETIQNCFREIAQAYDPTTVMINVTGGEPLLRPDLFDIMTFVASLGFPWGMVTNGSLIQTDIVNKMRTSGMKTISISLDGLPDTHNRIRRISNGFEKIRDAVKLLKNADFLDEIQITTVVNHENIHELDVLLQILQQWGVDSWRLAIVDPIGRAQDNNAVLLTDEDYHQYFSFFEKNQFNGKITLMTSCSHYLGPYDSLYRKYRFSCSTGWHVGSILANGDIYVCPNVPRVPELIQGNIKRDSFPEVWEKGFRWFRDGDRQKSSKCINCKYYTDCKGDSLHTWDFTKQEPKFCYRDHLFGYLAEKRATETAIKDKLLSFYPKMKGIQISYGNCSNKKILFTPHASSQLLMFFEWGEQSSRNCFELLAGLAGFQIDHILVVEHIIPGNLENRDETTAVFSNQNLDDLLRELTILNKGRVHSNEKYKLSGTYSLIGIAHTHPLALSAVLSIPDIELQGQMQKSFGDFVSLLLNPQEKQIAAYCNSVFTPIDLELLLENEFYATQIPATHNYALEACADAISGVTPRSL